MDLRHIKYFIAVAEELNIGRAALKLHISQPPLTRQIKQLEDELGVQLFHRTPRGVELTQAGEMFLVESKNIRSLVESAVERTSRAGQGKLGRLDVGFFGSAIFSAIPQILQHFRSSYPDVTVALHSMTKQEQIQALRQQRITVGITRLPAEHADITSQTIIDEDLYLAAHTDSALCKKKSVSLSELSNHPLIVFPNTGRPNFADKVIKICSAHGFTPSISHVVTDANLGVALVAAGYGICLVPASVATLKLPSVIYIPIKEHPIVDLSCVYRSDDRSPLLAAFLAVTKNFRDSYLSAQAPRKQRRGSTHL
jgi:DNA-binding transcriptional LysR family regulator